jgi:hypothetical protein
VTVEPHGDALPEGVDQADFLRLDAAILGDFTLDGPSYQNGQSSKSNTCGWVADEAASDGRLLSNGLSPTATTRKLPSPPFS